MTMSFNNVFGIHEKALVLRSKKAEILSSNIANSTTPGYKARDFDFQKALKVAMSQQSSAISSNQKSDFGGSVSEIAIQLDYIRPFQTGTGDGNTVDLPSQQLAFAQNAMEYQMSLRYLDGKIKGLLAAIKGE